MEELEVKLADLDDLRKKELDTDFKIRDLIVKRRLLRKKIKSLIRQCIKLSN